MTSPIFRDRALAGLLAWCAAAGMADAAEDAPVQLPPVIVTETIAARPWRYARADGFEVLTRCRDSDTVRILRRNGELAELLALALPPEFQFRTTMPQTMVLVDADDAPSFAQRIIGASATRFLPNLELMDADAFTVFEIVRGSGL